MTGIEAANKIVSWMVRYSNEMYDAGNGEAGDALLGVAMAITVCIIDGVFGSE